MHRFSRCTNPFQHLRRAARCLMSVEVSGSHIAWDRAFAPRLITAFSNASGRHVLRGTCPIVGMLRSAAPASARHPTTKPCRRRASGPKSKHTAPRPCSAAQLDPSLRIRARPALTCFLFSFPRVVFSRISKSVWRRSEQQTRCIDPIFPLIEKSFCD
jgi:hypothetical protein